VGKAWPISEIKILDDDGNELPPGEVGTSGCDDGRTEDFEYHKDGEDAADRNDAGASSPSATPGTWTTTASCSSATARST
jgi:hypothetical protein